MSKLVLRAGEDDAENKPVNWQRALTLIALLSKNHKNHREGVREFYKIMDDLKFSMCEL